MSSSTDYDCTFKILVLGDSGVGKTCLIYRYTEDLFSEAYVSTIGIDCRTTMLDMDDLKVRMQIWDTAGQERFRTLTSAYYRGAMGVLLVYDVTSEESFTHVASWLRNIEDVSQYTTFTRVASWLRNIEDNANADVCKILVGNKADIKDERDISKERGQMVAENNNLQFFETSAKYGDGVSEAFLALANLIKELKDSKDHIPDDISSENTLKMPQQQNKCC